MHPRKMKKIKGKMIEKIISTVIPDRIINACAIAFVFPALVLPPLQKKHVKQDGSVLASRVGVKRIQ